MARYFDIHPANPQRRAIIQIADIVRAGGVIAYPTDSCYALGCQLGNSGGITTIRSIRHLDDRHHLTLVCQDFAQLGQFVYVAKPVFRAIKAATPGSYTFILPATKEVPRRLQHPGKKTVGVRIPRHVATQALLAELGEPLVSSTLLLPGQDEPMTQGWEIAEQLDHAVDAVIDSGDCGTEPTTVIDFSQQKPEIVRRGAGDTSGFEWKGFTVLTPPNLLHGVAGDAAYVASFLAQRTTGPVVLVGHSYGGVVITNAGTAGGDVKALVYVDAFIPDVGETVFQIVASQRPITLGANTSPTETAAWKTLPSWAVVGTEDRVIPPATQRSMAERAGSTITEIAGSHVSMVSHPAAAIEAILAAVAAVDG